MVEIIERKSEVLFSRDKVIAEVVFDGATPSVFETKKKLAGSLKVKEDLVVVRKINSSYGGGKALVEAYVYTDVKSKDAVEAKHMLKKNTPPKVESVDKKDAPAPAEKPAEPAQDTLKEEAKEVSKSKEKKEVTPEEEEKKE